MDIRFDNALLRVGGPDYFSDEEWFDWKLKCRLSDLTRDTFAEKFTLMSYVDVLEWSNFEDLGDGRGRVQCEFYATLPAKKNMRYCKVFTFDVSGNLVSEEDVLSCGERIACGGHPQIREAAKEGETITWW